MSDLKRKPLYQPWNEEAFRADLHVGAMTPTQRWIYRTLLQAAFFHSTRPHLPDDDAQLWLLAGCETPKQWERNKGVVRAMFTPVEVDGLRLLSQKRLLADWDRLEEKRQILSENGRRGRKAQLQSSNRPANAEQMPGNCPPFAGQEKLKEVEVKRSEVKENLKPAPKPPAPADPRFQPFLDFAFGAFEQKHGQKPTWSGKDFRALSTMLASNKGLGADELQRRFRNYISSTETFTQKQGDSLAYFSAHTDSFLAGPMLAVQGKGASNGNAKSSANNAAASFVQHFTEPKQDRLG